MTKRTQQSRQNRRTLLILGVLFAALLIVVVWQGAGGIVPLPQFRAEPTPTDELSADLLTLPRVLTDFRVLDIQAIRIGNPNTNEEVLLARGEDGTWQLPEAVDGADTLDTENATLVARTLVLLPYTQTISIAEDTELAQFGFVRQNPGALTVEVLLADGTAHALFFGGLTPQSDAIYTAVDDRDVIYLVEPRAVEFLRFQLRTLPVNLTTE